MRRRHWSKPSRSPRGLRGAASIANVEQVVENFTRARELDAAVTQEQRTNRGRDRRPAVRAGEVARF